MAQQVFWLLFGGLVTTICNFAQVGAFSFNNDPEVHWNDYNPENKPVFKMDISRYMKKPVCEAKFSSSTNQKSTLCESDFLTDLMRENEWSTDDTSAECTESGDVPPKAGRACWIRHTKKAKMKLGLEKQTCLEIQLWTNATRTYCRYSTPYG